MKYRIKPIEVEAIQWTGNNLDDCKQLTGDKAIYNIIDAEHGQVKILLHTPEGDYNVWKYDYIVKLSNGDFYTYDPKTFEEKFEIVEE
ncbi:MAG: hypothetical protein IKR19_09010 [Acholeplasmatales bacterium]|nr:hypothetical protein [Acholeplasmatales bacterium]